METLLKLRIAKLANNYGLVYTLMLEPMLILGIILNINISSYYLIIYILFPLLFIFKAYKNKNSCGYHIQRGLFITLCMVIKRRRIMLFFYTLVITLIYLMTTDLALYKPKYSIFVFTVLYIFKVLIYYMSYNTSRYDKDDKSFEIYNKIE